jgi:cytochrome c553
MKIQRFLTITLMSLILSSIAEAAGNVAAGEKIATAVCAACHGADGNSLVSMYPKLAAQHPAYITKQLMNFKAGERQNAIMAGMVTTLTPEDMSNLGAYFGAQSAKSASATKNGPGSLGEKIYKGGIASLGVPACASCHGANGAGIPVQFPRLAGQHAEYTITQMKAWRSGERANDPAKMMRMVASKLSDADIEAVADYIQGLK